MGGKHPLGYMQNYYLKNKEHLKQQHREYREKHIAEDKQAKAKYYQQHKEAAKQRCKKYYKENKPKLQSKMKQYREDNKESLLPKKRQYYMEKGWIRKTRQYIERKEKVIQVLGGKCVKCGFTDIRALQVDHVNGNGHKESKTIGYYGIYGRILAGQIEGYQLLCANCNWIKRYDNSELGKNRLNRLKQI